MTRSTKLNSIGESMENCRKALLICEALEVQPDLAGRPSLVTAQEEGTVDMTGEGEALTPEAEEILKRDSVRPGSFIGNNFDCETQYVCKNGNIVSSSYSRAGILGQANLIAVIKKFEDAGLKQGEDYGVLSVGGAFGKYLYLWYNPKSVKTVNLLAQIEKDMEDYPVIDDDLQSSLESVAVDNYWKNCMDKDEKIAYYDEHGAEVDPAWQAEDFDGEIPPPEDFNSDGDISSKVTNDVLDDEELKASGLDIPASYFI